MKGVLLCIFTWAALLPSTVGVALAASNTWLPVRETDLTVKEGAALDFSHLVEMGPAGSFGHVIIRNDGSLGFKMSPAKGARFFCASQPYGVQDGFPDRATADRYARQLRIHGYNLARFSFVDNILMTGKSKDFDFDAIQLDRFHYFLAALKREGIYWMLDGLTSWNGAYGDVGGDRWARRRNVKKGLYYSEEQREHWKELVGRILGAVNRYTGIRIVEDPALVGIILVNEGGLNYLLHQSPDDGVDRLFQTWLQNKYGSLAEARKSWGGTPESSTNLLHRSYVKTAKGTDAQRFYYALQVETLAWMTKHVRDMGFPGLITGFDNWSFVQDHATRSHLEALDFHTYHDHPSNFIAPGSVIKQSSSLDNELEYVRLAATARQWGKPFTLTEYDHPFWNRWRFESGLSMGAYAALQGWDLICRHGSGPIELRYNAAAHGRRGAIYPFGLGLDPVTRASETLAALLFLRGDVRKALGRVGLRLTPEFVFDRQGGVGRIADGYTKLALVTAVGLVWGGADTSGFDVVFTVEGDGPAIAGKIKKKIGLGDGIEFGDLLLRLKKSSGFEGNASQSDGVYVSDTGEIMLRAPRGELRIVTPRTEAVAFRSAPGRLDALRIQDVNGPGLFAVSALDGNSIRTSKRMLLIAVSHAENTGMVFADAAEREILNIGRLPVQMQPVAIRFALDHERSGKFRLYSLRFNGERLEELPLSQESGAISGRIDTVALKHGPTTFFELVENE